MGALAGLQRAGDLLVSEIFGPTFQGEGPSAGRQAVFVRLSRCNLACTWCDTAYTWDWKRFDVAQESHRAYVEEIAGSVLACPAGMVVITGGEPLLQQHALIRLLRLISGSGRRIEIETNGTIPPLRELTALVDTFNVSPKLANSGVLPSRRTDRAALSSLAACGKAVFKFVLSGPDDVQEVAALEQDFGLSPVWVMPEGATAESVQTGMQALAEDALAHGWNLSSRLHILVWGDQRGR
ncbi:MAG TPA: 7-carboxy-7-deazaguanine synthase QueE [Streptosporangiaceae bacterium]|nr:7-carboxy-7-deazaguanine synthase QueE [Streptosporangiaceae bacterium]